MAEEAENTETTQETTQESGKSFTQADVDRIAADRLSRERKNRSGAERMNAFEEWEKSRQTEAEKAAETAKKLREAEAAAEQLRHENAEIIAGVNTDDADHILYNVEKIVFRSSRMCWVMTRTF